MPAELSVSPNEPAGTWAVAGELDTHTAPRLADALDAIADDHDVTLDLAETAFISSAGLSVILNTQRRLEAGGGSLRVANPSAAVARVIELAGLATTLGLS